MSVESKVRIGCEAASQLLKNVGIVFDGNTVKKNPVEYEKASDEFKRALRGERYDEAFSLGRSRYEYYYLFGDGSYMVIWIRHHHELAHLHYYYFDTPIDVIPYEQFVTEFGFDLVEVGDSLMEEYSQYLGEAPVNTRVTPLRYDYSPFEYRGVIHPASHLHIGGHAELRIPIRTLWTPFEFVCFWMKSFRFSEWCQAMTGESIEREYLSQKSHSINLASELFSSKDSEDYHLA